MTRVVFGNGGFANEDIAAGEEIASIPTSLVLTTRVARNSDVGRIVCDYLNDNPNVAASLFSSRSGGGGGGGAVITRGRAILCIFMIHGKFLGGGNNQEDRGEEKTATTAAAGTTTIHMDTAVTMTTQSKEEEEEVKERTKEEEEELPNAAREACFWRHYLQSLPVSYSTPLWWSMHELEHLKGTNLLAAVEERKDKLYECYRLLLPKLSNKYPKLFPPQYFTW